MIGKTLVVRHLPKHSPAKVQERAQERDPRYEWTWSRDRGSAPEFLFGL
jgi:hypothetical protein